mmetsp:Transcript_17149/g.37423  ORF Transcript_17149/g.37423 Transcript_17149/m.37423 type:complete len:109 (-) Transcript_17149:141-467(-)
MVWMKISIGPIPFWVSTEDEPPPPREDRLGFRLGTRDESGRTDDDFDVNDDERRTAAAAPTDNGRLPGSAIVVEDVRRTRRIQAESSHDPATIAGDCCDDRLLFILIF